MKKIVFAMIAALTVSSAAMAQDSQRRERRQFDQKEMTQRRTDMVVKKYGLNDQQAKDLLALNTEFAGKMRTGMRGFRGQRPQMNGGEQPKAEKRDSLQRRQRSQRGQGAARQMPNREEMEKNMKEYETKLQAIMTADQYKAYQADQEKMRQQRGQRQHRNN